MNEIEELNDLDQLLGELEPQPQTTEAIQEQQRQQQNAATLAKLEELDANEQNQPTPFIKDMEPIVVSVLIDYPQFCHAGALKPEHFTEPICQLVVAQINKHLKEFGTVPTRAIIKEELGLTEEDPWERIYALIDRVPHHREVPYVKQKIGEFIRHRIYERLYADDVIDAHQRGDHSIHLELIRQAATLDFDQQGEVFGFVNADDFMQQDFTYDFYIENVLVAGEPFLMGGPKKALKTGLLCDMVVSLATATPFLGKFVVPKERRVAYFSAECGQHQIQNRLQTIQRAKQVTSLKNLFLAFEPPTLSSPSDLAKISDFIQRNEIEVVVVDPLYLTMMSGESEVNAGNLYQMGPLFRDISRACGRHGATPILAHHFKKSAGGHLDLDDFAFVGAAEFARQSLLVQRSSPFTSPVNNLLDIRTHGYARGERWAVHLDESKWMVTVTPYQEAALRAAQQQADRLVTRLRDFLQRAQAEDSQRHITAKTIRDGLGWNHQTGTKAIEAAIEQGFVEEYQGEVAGNPRPCYRRVL